MINRFHLLTLLALMTAMGFCSSIGAASEDKPLRPQCVHPADAQGVLGQYWKAPGNTVVAVVNGEQITKSQLMKNLWDWNSLMVLNGMIDLKTVAQAAKDAGVTVTQAELDKRLEELRQKIPGNFEDTLRKYHLTQSRFEAQTLNSLLLEKIAVEEAVIEPSDYKQFVKARHILIKLPEGEDRATAEQQALQKANRVYQEIKDGKSFAAAAVQYSDDRATKGKGGELGWIRKGQMVKEFENTTFALKSGEISKPVKTPFGYHIIQVEEHGQNASDEKKLELRRILVEQELPKLTGPVHTRIKSNAQVDNVLKKSLEDTRWSLGEDGTCKGSGEFVQLRNSADSTVVATVNGEKITKGELTQCLWFFNAPETLRDMINQRTILQAAKSAGVTVTQAEVEKRVKELKAEVSEPLKEALPPPCRIMEGTRIATLAERTFEKQTQQTREEHPEAFKEWFEDVRARAEVVDKINSP